MMGHASRRQFLATAAAAGSLLVARPASARAPETQQTDSHGNSVRSPLTVITAPAPSDVNPRGRAWIYIAEILKRAGLFFNQISPLELEAPPAHRQVIVLGGNLQFSPAQQAALSSWVEKGGALIGIGGTSGLDAVFGVNDRQPLMEGWMQITAPHHPITADLRSSLHVFGGFALKTDSATTLATLDTGRQGAQGAALVENHFGEGHAILIGPDLLFSIVHMQQGLPVLQDGKPPADDSAPIDDGELKAEDGLVLNWQRDRTPMEPDKVPVFLEPISDELRGIIVRGILHMARCQDIALPILWQWPRGLPAVGHISHDTDGHDPQKAVAMLEVMNRCDVKSTWCTLYPGGYPREFYEQLKQQGYEIALHYDARTGGPGTSWSYENLVMQHRWLKEAAGLDEIVSNKNHYTRWENRLDFLRWCERLGIKSDQTRGPSKQGTIGFPLGGSQPYFPLDERAGRFLDVLEVNMLTQDLVVVCPAEYGRQLVDSVLRQHGVAHFLFHPAHILKPGVAAALSDLIDYGRSKGMEWWTNEQIYTWETLRRGVQTEYGTDGRVTIHCAQPLEDVSLLLLKPQTGSRSISINDRAMKTKQVKLYGFDFEELTTDLSGDVLIQLS